MRGVNIARVTRVQIGRKAFDVYGGRAGHGYTGEYGNPYSTHLPPSDPFYCKTRTEAIAKFEQYAINRFNTDEEFRNKVLALDGKTIGCFCRLDQPCHCDVYIMLVERYYGCFW